MTRADFVRRITNSTRHRTSWIEAGLSDGPLLFLLHGWPELSLVCRAQMRYFAAASWRCVAPDMRGYGGSSVPDSIAAHALREVVADMVELYDTLNGSQPAVWIGHDWGGAVAWAIGSHHAARCRAVASLCIPYFSRGSALPTLVPLVDRALYPVDRYPVSGCPGRPKGLNLNSPTPSFTSRWSNVIASPLGVTWYRTPMKHESKVGQSPISFAAHSCAKPKLGCDGRQAWRHHMSA